MIKSLPATAQGQLLASVVDLDWMLGFESITVFFDQQVGSRNDHFAGAKVLHQIADVGFVLLLVALDMLIAAAAPLVNILIVVADGQNAQIVVVFTVAFGQGAYQIVLAFLG
nr:hypothetical protein [Pseudomonas tumuqii]